MGTFTFPYFLRHAIWEKRGYWVVSAGVFYFGQCWDKAGMAKAQMMKGHSKMYASRNNQIPKNSDTWSY